MKGESLLDCIRNKYKDQWITANKARECDRGGAYARQVLDTAASLDLIERKVELKPLTLYRIDPQNGEPVCPYEPDKPYNDSLCHKLEELIECTVQGAEAEVQSNCIERFLEGLVRGRNGSG